MRRTLHLVFAAAILLPCIGAAPPASAQSKPLQVQESNIEGVNAELTEATLRDGVLTVKLRFRNTGSKPAYTKIVYDSGDIDKYYVVAGKTKLLPLRDSEKVPLMSALSSSGHIDPEIKPGGSYLFWVK
ncbi:MAG TPA: hypothetical protein VLS49_08755, partial [Usitatibacter sp.]|nr:hypothetical protein [Usitatibacter sp.]